jgi:CheY-like chemotaxis protein/nitrogen-specific signal transduction histidine kinase
VQVSEADPDEVADLEQTIESLQAQCRQKDGFIATLAHELRNPLTALRAAVHLHEAGGDDPAIRRKSFDIVARQATHMERLINDLMDLSRLSRAKISLDLRTIDLSAVVGQVFVDRQRDFEEIGLESSIRLSDEPVWVEADSTRVAQICGNLLDNAVQAASPGDEINVAVRKDCDRAQAVLSVSDTGAGLDAKEAEQFFDRFEQPAAGGRAASGLGLGPAIVQGLVELHGGWAEAHSDGPGEGATFLVGIPLSDRPTRRADGGSNAESIRRRQVLIVEDDSKLAELLVYLLEREGHCVEHAGDAEQALDKLKSFDCDTILCDLQLPGELDGHGFCQAVKVDPRFDSVRLIAMTGRGGAEARTDSFGSGFDDHVTKPVDLDELRRVLSVPG